MSDISKYTVIETKGWMHALSNKLFDTKEEANHNWAVNIFSTFVSRCSTYDSLDEDMFIAKIGESGELRMALGILSKPLITGGKNKTGWRIVCPKCKQEQATDHTNNPVTCIKCKYTWRG